MSSHTAILITRKSKLYIRCEIVLPKSKGQQQSHQLCARWGKDLPCGMDDLRMHLKITMTAAEKNTSVSLQLPPVSAWWKVKRRHTEHFQQAVHIFCRWCHLWYWIQHCEFADLPQGEKKSVSFIMTIDVFYFRNCPHLWSHLTESLF